MPNPRICLVSFTDSNGIRHAVEVAASTLYEAATLAMAEFRRCGFTADAPGPATRLTVSVKAPSTTHEIQWGKVEVWLQSAGCVPGEPLCPTGSSNSPARVSAAHSRTPNTSGSRVGRMDYKTRTGEAHELGSHDVLVQ